MSEPNGQRGATTPTDSSTPVPWTGTVPRATESTAAEGVGQPTNSASTPQAMRTSIHAGDQQAVGGSNAAGQKRKRSPENDRGRGEASPSNSTSRATIRSLSEGPRGRSTQDVLRRERYCDKMEAVWYSFLPRRQATQATQVIWIPRDHLFVQTDVYDQIIQMVPISRSMRTRTNFMTQSHTHKMGIDVKLCPDPQDGWEAILETSKLFHRQTGAYDILWTARRLQDGNQLWSGTPLRNAEDDERDIVEASEYAGPGRPGSEATAARRASL